MVLPMVGQGDKSTTSLWLIGACYIASAVVFVAVVGYLFSAAPADLETSVEKSTYFRNYGMFGGGIVGVILGLLGLFLAHRRTNSMESAIRLELNKDRFERFNQQLKIALELMAKPDSSSASLGLIMLEGLYQKDKIESRKINNEDRIMRMRQFLPTLGDYLRSRSNSFMSGLENNSRSDDGKAVDVQSLLYELHSLPAELDKTLLLMSNIFDELSRNEGDYPMLNLTGTDFRWLQRSQLKNAMFWRVNLEYCSFGSMPFENLSLNLKDCIGTHVIDPVLKSARFQSITFGETADQPEGRGEIEPVP